MDMRGDERVQDGMFSYVSLEQRVPQDHPLRAVRKVTDVVLEARSAELDALYDDPSVVKLIETHVFAARRQTAPGSAHALDLSGLKSPDISVWVACRSGDLVGTGALKRLSTAEGEVKSMYTAPSARRCGVARVMLAHIIDSASGEGLARLSLETGSWSYFEPAIALYASFGFVKCRPFGDYREDPNSMSAGAKLPTSDGP